MNFESNNDSIWLTISDSIESTRWLDSCHVSVANVEKRRTALVECNGQEQYLSEFQKDKNGKGNVWGCHYHSEQTGLFQKTLGTCVAVKERRYTWLRLLHIGDEATLEQTRRETWLDHGLDKLFHYLAFIQRLLPESLWLLHSGLEWWRLPGIKKSQKYLSVAWVQTGHVIKSVSIWTVVRECPENGRWTKEKIW